MIRSALPLCSAILILFSFGSASLSEWTYSTLIKLNTSASGANVAGTVADFPVLIRLTPDLFDFEQAQADGGDIRFSLTDHAQTPTELPFQIERWDKASRLAEIWVKVPQILGNNSQQTLKMYWGHVAPPTLPPAEPVFGASNEYKGVWHLGENPGTAAGGYKDATASGIQGTAGGSVASVAAVAGKGPNFNGGSGQGITLDNTGALHPTTALSVEFWVKANSTGPYKRMVSKAYTSYGGPWTEWDVELSGGGDKVAFAVHIGGNLEVATSTTSISPGTWYHVAGTYDGSTMRIYVNGNQEGTFSKSGNIPDWGRPVTIGRYEHDENSNFNGKLDEVRISLANRSADWVKLAYMNQRLDQKLVEMQNPGQFMVSGTMYRPLDMNGYDINNVGTMRVLETGSVKVGDFDPSGPIMVNQTSVVNKHEMVVTLDSYDSEKKHEAKLDGSGLHYRITSLVPGPDFGSVMQSTEITEGGINTSGDISAKSITATMVITPKWKVQQVPDYVFAPDYQLPPLSKVEAFVKANRHLPGIPTAKQIEADGMELGAMNLELLKHVEHLHLYIMEQNRRLEDQNSRILKQEKRLGALEAVGK